MDHLPIGPLHRRLARLSRRELEDRLHAVRALSAVRGLRFLDDQSQPRTIDLALVPWIVTSNQLAHFRQVARMLIQALMHLPRLYAQSRAVRAALPFDNAQESWMRLAAQPPRQSLAVIGRLDSTATFSHAAWRKTFMMLEPNGVGVGGVHYAPAACSVVLDVLGDVLEQAYPGHRIVPTPDPRVLLLDELARVGRRIGRRIRRIVLIENADYTTGTDEFASLARYCSRRGLPAVVADPRQLEWSGGRLMVKGREIDLIYRDCELSEFIDMESHGRRLAALRRAVQEGRLISGLLWEFDLKSSWEVFTDPVLSKQFPSDQRRLFRQHLPWTRLVREGATSDPHGRRVDLVPFIRRRKDALILKPNTLYGGQGVMIGNRVSRAVWERRLAESLRGDLRYVVQRLAPIGTERFWHLVDGRVREVERSVVSGFFFNSADVGLVGRFSADPVVNVSRGGGLLCALMVQ